MIWKCRFYGGYGAIFWNCRFREVYGAEIVREGVSADVSRTTITQPLCCFKR